MPSDEAPVVTIEAKPQPIAIDVARTAVIVVDMQNDFGADRGACVAYSGDLSEDGVSAGSFGRRATR
jgi:hypothetical protein